MLPKEAIIEFQQVYKEIYGIDLPFSEAEIQARIVFHAIKATYQPLRKEWFERLKDKEVNKNNGKVNS